MRFFIGLLLIASVLSPKDNNAESREASRQSPTAREADRLFREIDVKGEYPSADVLAKSLAHYSRESIEAALLALFGQAEMSTERGLLSATMIAQAYDSPKIRDALLHLAESRREKNWVAGRAAISLGVLGDSRIIPISVERYRETTDVHLRGYLLESLMSFQEMAAPRLRSLFRTQSDFNARVGLLARLVALNDTWGVHEYSKKEYASERFRRNDFWRREVRLKQLKNAAKGKLPKKEDDYRLVPMPPSYRAPYEK